ncbi:MAG: sucrase ferredoxin [Phormidesmis sp.]
MFCTVAAQQAGERIVGTASHYDAYVLIECPKPWPVNAFTSKGMPSALRQFIKATKAQRSVQFLCIAGQHTAITSGLKVLIYEKAEHAIHAERTALSALKTLDGNGFSRGYVGYEFEVDSLEQVIPCVEAYWQQEKQVANVIQTQDLLVCTHGMRDMCCARFGQPFYRQAKHLAKLGQLPNTRTWQVSHIGGHRFAPTAISLPDGRYYGRLTVEALAAIANRQGPIEQIVSVYRGWGVLPQPVQFLEQRLLLQHGWSWLDAAVSYRCESDPSEESTLQIELSVQFPDSQFPDGQVSTYRAVLKRDTSQPYCVQASCSATVPATFVKYVVTELSRCTALPARDFSKVVTSG